MDGGDKEVNEPVLNTDRINFAGTQLPGGQTMIDSLVWVSKIADVPMKTKVTTLNKDYSVIASGRDVVAGFFYYQLKEVETQHTKESSGFDD